MPKHVTLIKNEDTWDFIFLCSRSNCYFLCMQITFLSKNHWEKNIHYKINLIFSDCGVPEWFFELSLASQAGSGGKAELEWGMRRGERGYCGRVDGTPGVLASSALSSEICMSKVLARSSSLPGVSQTPSHQRMYQTHTDAESNLKWSQ